MSGDKLRQILWSSLVQNAAHFGSKLTVPEGIKTNFTGPRVHKKNKPATKFAGNDIVGCEYLKMQLHRNQ